jgi:tRNA(Ile)-lysidine synthase
MPLSARVLAELERLTVLPPRLGLGRVLVAVSGGLDSVSLLQVLHGAGLDVRVAHLDHGIRSESVDDAWFVQSLCEGLNVPCDLERVNVPEVAARRGWGLEEAARKLRYDFLTRVAKRTGAAVILTAHTRDDNAETVLMQLLRGTVRATGIPSRRERILRPMLGISRAELQAFAFEHGLEWREDASNADRRFTRNWIRHEVLPLLETRNPNVRRKLAEHAELMRDEDALLEAAAARVPSWTDWRHEPVAVQRRLIRRSLEAASLVADLEHIETIRAALAVGKVTRVSLPRQKTAMVQAGRLRIFESPVESPVEPTVEPFANGAEPEWPAFDFSAFPWARLRTRKPGDRIRLSGGTRKLSDVLIDHKIPRELRDQVPVVAQNSEVLWLGLGSPLLDVRIGSVQDHEFAAMTEALELARAAFDANEVPVGAVVIQRRDSGFLPLRLEDDPKFKASNTVAFETVGCGRNRSKQGSDMTLHAELEAIRDACRSLKTAHLNDCTLVVTLEPCLMCLGAILESRIGRVVFAARNPKNGALGGVIDASRADWTHSFAVRSGLLEAESAGLLERFFAAVRAKDRAQDPAQDVAEQDSSAENPTKT